MFKFISFLILLLILRLALFIFFPPPVSFEKNIVREATIFTSIKDHIHNVYLNFLPAQDADLLMGIVFGEKDLDPASMKDFQATGVLHIIAASGMNVTMLTEFVLAFLLLFLKRRQALIVCGAIVIFYTALGDFAPSIVRASLMAFFAFGAGVTGRQNTSLLALFFAAWVMVFYDPTVAVSVSFILSFIATLGIILLDPIFKTTILRVDVLEDFRTTLSAQIATTPILLFFFGIYSPISIITNLLVLWTVPPLMVFGMVSAVLSIVPLLAAPVTYLCLPLLSYFWMVIEFFAKHSNPVKVNNIPWTIVLGYYLILAAGIVLYHQKRPKTKIQKEKAE